MKQIALVAALLIGNCYAASENSDHNEKFTVIKEWPSNNYIRLKALSDEKENSTIDLHYLNVLERLYISFFYLENKVSSSTKDTNSEKITYTKESAFDDEKLHSFAQQQIVLAIEFFGQYNSAKGIKG